MARVVPLRKVKKDYSTVSVKSVYNPLTEEFTHKFDGEEITIPAGKRVELPENVAVHMARHLAKKIVTYTASNEREALLKTIEQGKRITVDSKPYPRFDRRTGDVAKLLVGEVGDGEVEKEKILENASEESGRKKKEEKKPSKVEFKENKKPIEAKTETKTKTKTKTKK